MSKQKVDLLYSFCERVTASSRSPWHIRKLGTKGHCYSGGADTPSLCGGDVGWDLQVGIRPADLLDPGLSHTHICAKCLEAWKAAQKK